MPTIPTGWTDFVHYLGAYLVTLLFQSSCDPFADQNRYHDGRRHTVWPAVAWKMGLYWRTCRFHVLRMVTANGPATLMLFHPNSPYNQAHLQNRHGVIDGMQAQCEKVLSHHDVIILKGHKSSQTCGRNLGIFPSHNACGFGWLWKNMKKQKIPLLPLLYNHKKKLDIYLGVILGGDSKTFGRIAESQCPTGRQNFAFNTSKLLLLR